MRYGAMAVNGWMTWTEFDRQHVFAQLLAVFTLPNNKTAAPTRTVFIRFRKRSSCPAHVTRRLEERAFGKSGAE